MKDTLITVLTERGQVSVPAAIRKRAKLMPGQRLRWQQVAPDTFSITVEQPPKRKPSALNAIGFANAFSAGNIPARTDDVMRELRAGES